MGVPLRVIAAVVDKYQRAQETAAGWNGVELEVDGRMVRYPRILVPVDAPWAVDFVDEVCAFTGDDDTNDDQVDALVSGVKALLMSDTRSVAGGDRRASGARSAY
jgi:hypothetical protein